MHIYSIPSDVMPRLWKRGILEIKAKDIADLMHMTSVPAPTVGSYEASTAEDKGYIDEVIAIGLSAMNPGSQDDL